VGRFTYNCATRAAGYFERFLEKCAVYANHSAAKLLDDERTRLTSSDFRIISPHIKLCHTLSYRSPINDPVLLTTVPGIFPVESAEYLALWLFEDAWRFAA